MQCAYGAMTAGAAATGARAWLAGHRPAWLTPTHMRRVTIVLVVAALLASATVIGGA